jgi:hypothetical protein
VVLDQEPASHIRVVITSFVLLHCGFGQGIDTYGYCNSFFVSHLFIEVVYKEENYEVVEVFIVDGDFLALFRENYKMNQTKIKMA